MQFIKDKIKVKEFVTQSYLSYLFRISVFF